MTAPRTAARWFVVALVAGCILYFSLLTTPDAGVSNPGPLGLVGADKWYHAAGYAVLAGTLTYALADRSRPVTVAVALAVGFGFVVELAQLAVPVRTFDLADGAANAFGASAAGTVRWAVRGAD